MTVFIDVLLPVFLIAVVAAISQRWLRLDPGPLSTATFYLFSPVLIFDAMAGTTVAPALLPRIALVVLLVSAVMWCVGAIMARLLGIEGRLKDAFLLAILLMNAGNFGLPISLFAFGEAGLSVAAVCFVVSTLVTATVGVFLAARGDASARESVLQVVKTPLVYAAGFGLLFSLKGWALPASLALSVELMAAGAIPLMLVVLGLQLHAALSLSTAAIRVPMMSALSLGRLVVAPLVAIGLCSLVGLTGVTRSVVILQMAMPTAIITTVMATEFDVEPVAATWMVAITTGVSLVTLFGWLTVL